MPEPTRPTRGNVSTVIETSAPPDRPAPADAGDESLEEITISQLLSGRRRLFPIPWPTAPHVTVGIHVLGRLEVTEAIAQARIDAKAIGNGETDPIVVERMFRDHVVQRALCPWPPPSAPDEEPELLFSSVEDLRLKVIEPDIENLYDNYARLEKAVCPLQRAEFEGNEKTFEEILARLGKSQGSLILSVIPREALEALVRYLASQRGEP